MSFIRRSCTIVAIACAVVFAILSFHWPLVGDATLMHYVVLLIDRGLVPYRDVVDINLPGTYGMEWVVMHTLGPGAVAWRIYDIVLCLSIMVAMSIVAMPIDRLAGLFAGALFLLVHGRDGIAELGQRDLLLTAGLFWATALLILALRKRSLFLLASGGLIAGFCMTVKPTAGLFWLAMILYIILAKAANPWKHWHVVSVGFSTFSIAPLVALFVIYKDNAFDAFWYTVTTLIPFHNTLVRETNRFFLTHLVPSSLIPITLLGLIVVCLRPRGQRDIPGTDIGLLLIGVICGILSFIVQRKALPYHRYPMDAFLLLLVSLIIFETLKSENQKVYVHFFAIIGVLAGAFVLAPQCAFRASQLKSSLNDFSQLLQKDLNSLGGRNLDRKVQCIDFTAGCVTTLDRMNLMQSTGFLYDCYALGSSNSQVIRGYRDAFDKALAAHPPTVIVLSDQDCGEPAGFDKLARWPSLNSFLKRWYVLNKEVAPPDAVLWARQTSKSYKYRIYLRRLSDPYVIKDTN